MYKSIAILAAVALTSACSSVQTAKEAKGSGAKQEYEVTKDQAWPAMISAVNKTGGSIKEKDVDNCYILASYGASAWSWGEKIAVFCSPKESSTEVEVVMKAAYKASVTAVERAPEILTAIKEELAQPAS